jgi:hypothetical protein
MNSTKKLGTNIEVNYIKKDGKQIKDSTYLGYTEEEQKQIQKKFIDKTTGEELKPITDSSTGKIITPEEQMKKRNYLFTNEEAKIFGLDTGNINKFVKIEPIKEEIKEELIIPKKKNMIEYEILVESFDGVLDKQVFIIESIENVLSAVKTLFGKGYKVVKIKNITSPIIAPSKPFINI